MKIEAGKIVEATEDELFSHWLKSDWCEFMSFQDFKRRYKGVGGVILDEDDSDA